MPVASPVAAVTTPQSSRRSPLRTLSIRTRIAALGAVAIAAVLAVALVSLVALSQVRIGGHRYQVISENNVLLADVLPPPAYLVEADLVAHQLLLAAESADGPRFESLVERAAQLRVDFDARQAYWTANEVIDGATRTAVIEDSAEPGYRFLELLEAEYIPALAAGDVTTARALLLGELDESYEAHRVAVDAIVALTGENAASTEADARALSSTLMAALAGVAVVVLVLVVGLCAIIGRSVSRPLDVLRRRLADIAAGGGDLRTRLAEDRSDELGEVATSFNRFVASLGSTIEEIRHQAEALTAEAEVLSTASAQLSATSQSTEDQTIALADASESVSGAIDSVMSAAREIQLAVGEISQSAATAATIAASGVDAAQRADAVMAQLGSSSNEITSVMGAINSIAEQTNLLALNATIEAARAGEAGKGFAVVASEVKDLAQATAEATTAVRPRVDAIQQSAASATTALDDVRRVIGEISSAQAIIAAAVEQQTATTAQIESHVAHAAQSADSINDSISRTLTSTAETAAGAAATTASAVRVAESAGALRHLVAQFTT